MREGSIMGRLFVSIIIAGIATPVAAQDVARALVCPPRLDYCYYVEKPVRAAPRGQDVADSVRQTLDCIERNPLLVAECRQQYGIP